MQHTQERQQITQQQEPPAAEAQDGSKRRKWDLIDKRWAATIIFSGLVLMLAAVIFTRSEVIFGALRAVFDVFMPILIGLVLALILYQPTRFFYRLFSRLKENHYHWLPANAISIFTVYFILVLGLSLIIRVIAPQLAESVTDFSGNIMDYYDSVNRYLHSEKGAQILNLLDQFGIDLGTLADPLSQLSSYLPKVVGTGFDWVKNLVGNVVNFFIGAVFSVYVLAGREKLFVQGRRILRHFLPPKTYSACSHYSRLTFSTFSNFISGQLIDAFTLGVLVFISMEIARLEYPLMFAVVIGLTNMIPYVGPWLGTVPCLLILLMINPFHAAIFLAIVLIAQQIDNKLIYPRIVGASVGLPAIWVLFAITVGGGMFHLPGLLFGVPVMAVIYAVLRDKTSGESIMTEAPEPVHPIQSIKQWIMRRRQPASLQNEEGSAHEEQNRDDTSAPMDKTDEESGAASEL